MMLCLIWLDEIGRLTTTFRPYWFDLEGIPNSLKQPQLLVERSTGLDYRETRAHLVKPYCFAVITQLVNLRVNIQTAVHRD